MSRTRHPHHHNNSKSCSRSNHWIDPIRMNDSDNDDGDDNDDNNDAIVDVAIDIDDGNRRNNSEYDDPSGRYSVVQQQQQQQHRNNNRAAVLSSTTNTIASTSSSESFMLSNINDESLAGMNFITDYSSSDDDSDDIDKDSNDNNDNDDDEEEIVSCINNGTIGMAEKRGTGSTTVTEMTNSNSTSYYDLDLTPSSSPATKMMMLINHHHESNAETKAPTTTNILPDAAAAAAPGIATTPTSSLQQNQPSMLHSPIRQSLTVSSFRAGVVSPTSVIATTTTANTAAAVVTPPPAPAPSPSPATATATATAIPPTTTTTSKDMYRMEQEIIAKQQGRGRNHMKKREPTTTVALLSNRKKGDMNHDHRTKNTSNEDNGTTSSSKGLSTSSNANDMIFYSTLRHPSPNRTIRSNHSIHSSTTAAVSIKKGSSVRSLYHSTNPTASVAVDETKQVQQQDSRLYQQMNNFEDQKAVPNSKKTMRREDAILQLDERIAKRNNSKVRLAVSSSSSQSKRNLITTTSTTHPATRPPPSNIGGDEHEHEPLQRTIGATDDPNTTTNTTNTTGVRTESVKPPPLSTWIEDDGIELNRIDSNGTKIEESFVSPSSAALNSALYLSSVGGYNETSLTNGLLSSSNNNYNNNATNNDDELEYGIYHTNNESDDENNKELAVAFAVNDDYDNYLLQNGDTYIPSAVEYDPDAKTSMIPSYYKNRRFRFYTCLVIIVVLVGTITASVSVTLTHNDSMLLSDRNGEIDTDIPYRHTLGIREAIERLVGTEKLNDVTSPYRKALDWIIDVDPLVLLPSNTNFVQRYFVAYFYYATTIKHPWSNGCNPPNPLHNETDMCTYKKIITLDPLKYTELPWQRWLTKEFECSWAGVYCDDAGFIRSLDFSGSNMTGTFPEGIVGFPFLQSFSFAFGQLEGTLPDALVEMKHLVNIELPGNLFTGTIPSAWFKSRSIQRINLSINQISGPISPDMSQIKDMKGIYIYENLLSGSLPTEIGLMRSLSFFRINRNYIQGSIPSTVGNLQLLYDVWMQRNMISGPIPTSFGLLEDLTDFRAQMNLISGSIPEEFYSMPSIRRLDIFSNRLTGTISPNISKLSLLDQFRINDNQISGTIPTEMGLMTNLASFVASGNNLVGTVPEALCTLRERNLGTYFIELQTDCIAPRIGNPEIFCPSQCCTSCCDANGTICIPTG